MLRSQAQRKGGWEGIVCTPEADAHVLNIRFGLYTPLYSWDNTRSLALSIATTRHRAPASRRTFSTDAPRRRSEPLCTTSRSLTRLRLHAMLTFNRRMSPRRPPTRKSHTTRSRIRSYFPTALHLQKRQKSHIRARRGHLWRVVGWYVVCSQACSVSVRDVPSAAFSARFIGSLSRTVLRTKLPTHHRSHSIRT